MGCTCVWRNPWFCRVKAPKRINTLPEGMPVQSSEVAQINFPAIATWKMAAGLVSYASSDDEDDTPSQIISPMACSNDDHSREAETQTNIQQHITTNQETKSEPAPSEIQDEGTNTPSFVP